MRVQTIGARRLHTVSGTVDYPVITMEDGCIRHMEAGPANDRAEVLTPSFLDIHVHGAVTHDFMHAAPRAIDAIGRFLATKGVAHYLPTTVTSDVDATLRALENLATSIASPAPRDAATPVGINLEGPFLCPAKRGVHPLDRILLPSVETFDRFQTAAQGHIRLMTVAPEMPGALELIRHAAARGVRVSLGHSNATAAETEAAIACGAVGATHTFNAMRAMDHREPGITGMVLDHDELYAEAIVDGVHVHPAMVRLWLKMKGEHRAILITDGMSATGMPDGTYMLGDMTVQVHEGVCLSEGVLAGSVLTLDRAVANVCRMTGASLATAVRLASHNPAAMLGLSHLHALEPGAPANFNIYDDAGNRHGSLLNGERLPV